MLWVYLPDWVHEVLESLNLKPFINGPVCDEVQGHQWACKDFWIQSYPKKNMQKHSGHTFPVGKF